MISEIVQNDNEGELHEHYRFNVDNGQSPLRIDKYLFAKIENATRSKIQQATTNSLISVNGKAVKPSYKVQPGDDIVVMLPEPVREVELLAEDIPINIVYEDADLMIVNKVPGMVVHPSFGHYSGTLVNAALGHFVKNNELNAHPHLVHRIDKDTSGLLIIAKNELAKNHLASQFFHHTIERKYVALCWGDFDEDEGSIEGNISRSKNDRRVMAIYDDPDIGKYALTHYKVIERFGYVTLTECKLETGRTHQIRAHFKYIKHPLFNDETYGGNVILRGTTFTKYKQFVKNCFKIIPRQALHAKSIGFVHPTTKKEMFFESDYPDDIKEVIEKWRHYARHRELYD